ncbi:ER membrane protein complex subunit 7 [Cryptosporidium felis]|nr:ER membrane protein complex subunit 7 [Cryptosporidium felis]
MKIPFLSTFISLFCCIALFEVSLVNCEEKIHLIGRVNAPEDSLMDTRIFITGREGPIFPNYAGHFRINLPKGEYILKVLAPDLVYNFYEIRIFEQEFKDGPKLVCKKFIFDIETGLAGNQINSPILNINPLYSTKETEDGQGGLLSLLSLLKNPLVLISVVSLGITIILPMLQDSLDMEAMEEITGSIPGGNYVSGFLSKIS